MPRNSQGLYTLPPGNPVIPNTLIESTWANPTMDDIALALTGSLPRNGTAPMTGPLTLAGLPTLAAQAASKAYVDQQASSVAGVPVGSVSMFAGATVPTSWLTCNGAVVSRTTYAALFAAIGVVYGAGDGSTTFALPDMRDRFPRGVGAQVLGATQVGAVLAHNHTATDAGHVHAAGAHTHSTTITTGNESVPHNHTYSDPGHQHPYGSSLNHVPTQGAGTVFGAGVNDYTTTGLGYVGITLNGPSVTHTHTGTGTSAASAGSVASGVASITVANNVGTENVPNNLALQYIIKASV